MGSKTVTQEASIAVENVTKSFGEVRAVKSVSFIVHAGEVVGFLGPNGAGKSTLLKMMSTWLVPTSGKIEIQGADTQLSPLSVRRALGYLTEHNALYDIMRVDRFLELVGRLRGLNSSRLSERTAWVVEKCGLAGILGKRIQDCSKGNRQRVGLAAALIHDPPIILLDEPTHGLDPLQVAAFQELLLELRRGRTVFFSNHILSELLAVCDRLLIMNEGQIVADTVVEALRAQARERGVEVDRVVLDLIRAGDGAS